MGTPLDAEAVVIGGGFAGIKAAVELARLGIDVELLEARPRLGGRAWTARFEEADTMVELGGGFFTAAHNRVQAELDTHGIGIRERPLPTEWVWRTAGELRGGWPVAQALRPELARIAFALAADQDDDRLHLLSLSEWCELRQVDPSIRDLLRAPWSITAGADPEAAAMADLFESLGTHGGPAGIPVMLSRAPWQGFSALADSMAADLPKVELEAEVKSVIVEPGHVEVGLADGRSRRAAAVVVALPVNVLAAITFELGPGEVQGPRIDALAGSSAGASLKLMIQADGIAEGSLAGGRGVGLDLLLADRRLEDGSMLVVGFGPRSDWDAEITDEAVADAVGAMYPDARVRAWTCHDWVNDPHSMGTWLASRPGTDPPDAPLAAPGEPVVFAGSDVASESAGWIEGALASGASAAEHVASTLHRDD